MRKTFELEDLDCANCARKMQEAIAKMDGVKDVSVNYMAQKMVLEADDDVFDKVLKDAIKAIKKVEPDCTVIL
ncbi:MAG: heavy-metal-associated domain-containing protein [Clostridia bacterium]|nr:heavy-metal-associated domain-containing protein [Clostridia bacterium]